MPRLSGKTLTFPRIRPCWRRAVGRGLTGVVRRRGTRARILFCGIPLFWGLFPYHTLILPAFAGKCY